MSARRTRRVRQSGAALILVATVLVLGATWFAVSALPKTATIRTEREIKTNQALVAAKQALLAYTAQYAARTDHDVPGRLPCPESKSDIGTANEGSANTGCTSTQDLRIGRLPWRTLGVDQLRDGEGEPLWYVLSSGYRDSPVNFGTTPQLTVDAGSNAAVAVIIAPGKPVNTLSEAGTPPTGCYAVNQQSGRYASPLDPAKFLECGNATGSYLTAGPQPWTNDRVMVVTAAEWADAIAGPVGERLQRQVLPMLQYWLSTESQNYWGVNFLPHASTFGELLSQDEYCGDVAAVGGGLTEGMFPGARSITAPPLPVSCTFWQSPSALTKIGGTATTWTNFGCARTSTHWRCIISYKSGTLKLRLTATAQRVTSTFRGHITPADISVTCPSCGNPTVVGYTVSTPIHSSPSSTGSITVSVDIDLPSRGSANPPQYYILMNPLPEPSGTFTSDNVRWFMQNKWDQYTYYAISPGTRANGGLSCSSPGASGCITVNGLPEANGYANDKRVVLALIGRPLPGQAAGTLESATHTLPSPTTYTGVPGAFTVPNRLVSNDVLAMCPFKYTASFVPCN